MPCCTGSEKRVIETGKGFVRLLPVSEGAKQLFGDEGAEWVVHQIEREPSGYYRLSLFPELQKDAAPRIRTTRRRRIMWDLPTEAASQAGTTTLDRVHAATLLQAGGRANARRALIKAEQERGPDFLCLANAPSALYPSRNEEKRLVDAMLPVVPK